MKQYNGEKAIISLTSWKKRINTVGKTIFSLLQQCPEFHIVLVLSEEEFPKKEEELPEDLKILIEGNKIEVVWVYKNYGPFKKVLFTMDKYKDVPIISADDGCLYIKNYAEELYNKWLENKDKIISEYQSGMGKYVWGGGGHGLLFPPNCFKEHGLKNIENTSILKTNHDDVFYGVLSLLLKIGWIFLNKKRKVPNTFIDFDRKGLTSDRMFKDRCFKEIEKLIKLG